MPGEGDTLTATLVGLVAWRTTTGEPADAVVTVVAVDADVRVPLEVVAVAVTA